MARIKIGFFFQNSFIYFVRIGFCLFIDINTTSGVSDQKFEVRDSIGFRSEVKYFRELVNIY